MNASRHLPHAFRIRAIMALVLIVGWSAAPRIADARLLAHWPLDDNANDASGNGHDGVLVDEGGVAFMQAGANPSTGSAAAFSGGHIDIPWSPDINTPNFTLALWVLPNASGGGQYRSPITNRDDVAPGGAFRHGFIIYNDNNGNWSFWNGGGPGSSGGWNGLGAGPVVVGEWIHLAISYDAGTNTKTFYLNGEVASTQNPAGFSPNNGDAPDANPAWTYENEDLHIGGGGDAGTSFRWDGLIDDVGLWDEALDQASIQSIMMNGVSMLVADPQLSVASPINLTFDGSVQPFAIPVANTGESLNLVVSAAEFSGADAANFSLVSLPPPIAPGASGDLAIRFDPQGANGLFEATLELTSNDSLAPSRLVAVRGVLHDPDAAIADRITAGPFPPLAGPQVISVEIGNGGPGRALEVSAATLSGRDSDVFAIGALPGPIPAGGTGILEITFNPGARDGSFIAALEITSNDPVDPTVSIPLAAEVVVAAPLVAFWPLDSDDTDATGNGHDGDRPPTVTYGAPGATARTGTAANFDGTDGIQVPFSAELNPDSFTFTAWARPTVTSGWNSVVTSREDNGTSVNGFILYNTPEGAWDFWTGGGGPPGSWGRNLGPASLLDEWQHLAITYDRATSTKTLYVDGINVASVVQPYSLNGATGPDTERPFNIGAGQDTGDGFFFVGDLDDVALFRVALPEAEILRIMNDGASVYLNLAPFVVTSVARDPATGDVTIEWNSKPGRLYSVERTIDLGGWLELDDGVIAPGETTSFTDTTLPDDTPTALYRVIEQ